MPPKKPAPAAGGKKTQEKKKEKVIEDRTFGLKNKKGAKQQKFIQNVTHQVKSGQQSAKLVGQDGDKTNKKADKKKELDELNELFKPVVAAQKVAKGVDPKSVLCAFFKQGQCTKGEKCKFSHDLSLDRKCEKRSLYVDERDDEQEKDSMENWDEKKLEEVVNTKHEEADKQKAFKTQKVCKYFLDAIETSKYGWFWLCPGGDSCMYRHALPPGFVLKKDKKEEKEEEISLEELIENERAALGVNVTRITLETFLAWKKRKRQERVDRTMEDIEKKRADFKAGRSLGVSGREVFEFRPDMIDDDDAEADDTRYAKVEDEDDREQQVEATVFQDIDPSHFVPKEVDSTGITVASVDRFTSRNRSGLAATDDEERVNGACDGVEASGLSGSEGGGEEGEDEEEEVLVDENLFTGEDLEELNEELDTMILED